MSYLIAAVPRTFQSDDKTYRFLSKSYINAFTKYQCTIVMMTTFPEDTSILNHFDALLLPGGLDLHPSYYHESLHFKTQYYSDETDEIELSYIRYFFQIKKPILAICRGIQTLNVALGGTLHQDIPMHMQNKAKDETFHKIIPHTLSFMKDITEVNSFHHQSIKDIASVFKIVSYSEDGYVEMIEYENIIGVQWHPELMKNDTVIPHFMSFLK